MNVQDESADDRGACLPGGKGWASNGFKPHVSLFWPYNLTHLDQFCFALSQSAKGNHNPSDILINIDWDFLVGMLINVWNIDDYMGLYKSMQIILGTIMDYQNLWRGNAVLNQAVFPGRHRVSNTAQSDIFLGNTKNEEDLNPSFRAEHGQKGPHFFSHCHWDLLKTSNNSKKTCLSTTLIPMLESVDFESMIVSCIKIMFKSMLRRWRPIPWFYDHMC